jgi:hypothetical protein
MAEDPKELQKVIKSLLGGMDQKGMSATVLNHLKKYIEDNKDNLLETLPKWQKTVETDLTDSITKADKNTIKNDSFDIFKPEKLELLAEFSRDIGVMVDKGLFNNKEQRNEIRTMVADSLGMNNNQTISMFHSLVTEYSKTPSKVAPAAPAAPATVTTAAPPDEFNYPYAEDGPEVIEPPPLDGTLDGGSTTVVEEAKQPAKAAWEIRLDAKKNEAAELLKEAEASLDKIAQYASKIPGKPTGIDEILARLNSKTDIAVKARDKLIENGDDEQASGIDTILKTAIAPNIPLIEVAKRDIEDIHDDLKDELKSVRTLKAEIEMLGQADESKLNEYLAELKGQVDVIEDGQKDALMALSGAAGIAQYCEKKLDDNPVFNHYSGYGAALEENINNLGGGSGFDILSQFTSSGSGGAVSPFESGINAVKNSFGRVGEWWHDTKMSARTQKERNMLNLAEQAAYGAAGLLALNAVNSMFFNDQMPAPVKWAIIIGMVGALINRSGDTGLEMVQYSQANSLPSYGQNSINHIPKSLATKGAADDAPAPSGTGTTADANNNTSTVLHLGAENGVPAIKLGKDTIKELNFEYPSGAIRLQPANGGTPVESSSNVIKLPEKGLELSVSAGTKEAIRDIVEEHIRDVFVPGNFNDLADRMQGTSGKNLPKDFSGDVIIDKINGVALGENAFTVHYVVGKGVVEDMMRERQAELQLNATGT